MMLDDRPRMPPPRCQHAYPTLIVASDLVRKTRHGGASRKPFRTGDGRYDIPLRQRHCGDDGAPSTPKEMTCVNQLVATIEIEREPVCG